MPGSGWGLSKPLPFQQRSLTYTPPISPLQNQRDPRPSPKANRPLSPHPAQTKGTHPESLPTSLPGCRERPSWSPPPVPSPPCGPWCMLQSMQFLCLFCLFFSQWGGWGGQGGSEEEVGVGAPSWGHREDCLLTCSLLLPFLPPHQTTTAVTTATRPAAATPAPAPSSSATAGAASQSTGPATGTTTVGTTAMRRTPTAPTRVGTWASRAGRDCPHASHSAVHLSVLHFTATWEPEITQTRLLSCRSFQPCGRGRLPTVIVTHC